MESEERLNAEDFNRSRLEYYEAGGKGINVSIVLNNLQVPTRATGFVGGFTKDFYIKLLEKYSYIQPNFTYTSGHTRINVKFSGGGMETELNAAGPYITNEDMENLMMKTNRLDEGDYFVLGGSCPDYLGEYVNAMLERLMNDGVKVILDVKPQVMEPALPFGPFMIKTRDIYQNDYYGRELSDAELLERLKELKAAGAKNVICTIKNGTEALLVCDEGIFHSDILHHERAVSMIGTGDALVGGFIMNSLRSSGSVDAFRFGCCCSTATAYSKGIATREKIEELYAVSTVTKLQ
ncbi:MAG: 1-phosphofructokinase family hexose kinase [Solobacterium sp.]|nr:1-phosphofructokinase family hexose kinase [Solobacterium sp.]